MLIGPGGAGAEPPRRRAVPRACSTLSSDASAAKEEPRVTDEPVYAQFGFTDAEWGLISGLPQSVLTAASAAESDGARRTRAEAAAGLDTISDGRESPSPLVAAVAAEIVARVGDPERGEELAVPAPPDPQAYAADVLARGRGGGAADRQGVRGRGRGVQALAGRDRRGRGDGVVDRGR